MPSGTEFIKHEFDEAIAIQLKREIKSSADGLAKSLADFAVRIASA
jgi:hypothetical protein